MGGVEDVNDGECGSAGDCVGKDVHGGRGDATRCRLSEGDAAPSMHGRGWTGLRSRWNKRRLSMQGSRSTIPSVVEFFGIDTGEQRPTHC